MINWVQNELRLSRIGTIGFYRFILFVIFYLLCDSWIDLPTSKHCNYTFTNFDFLSPINSLSSGDYTRVQAEYLERCLIIVGIFLQHLYMARHLFLLRTQYTIILNIVKNIILKFSPKHNKGMHLVVLTCCILLEQINSNIKRSGSDCLFESGSPSPTIRGSLTKTDRRISTSLFAMSHRFS